MVVECRCCRRCRTAGIRATRGKSRPCSSFSSSSLYANVHQHIAIVIQFDHVVKLRECDYGHRLRKRLAELLREAKVSMFHQVEVVVVSEIGGQVECVPSVAVFVVVVRDADALVSV